MDGGKAQLKKLHFMDIEEIEEVIRKEEKLIDSPDELVTEIATQLYKSVKILFFWIYRFLTPSPNNFVICFLTRKPNMKRY